MGFDFFCVLSTGLKAPTVTNHNTPKTAASNQTVAKTAPTANQGMMKQVSLYPFQRSGSARLGRLNSASKDVWEAVCVTITCLCTHVVCWEGEMFVCKLLPVCQHLRTALIPGSLAIPILANIQCYHSYCMWFVCFDMCGFILNEIQWSIQGFTWCGSLKAIASGF